MANIGLNVVEVDGKATPSIQPAPTSVAGFVIRSQRGIADEVVRVTNWSQFVEHFGSYMDDAYGAYAVRGFFDNGGTTAYITRVVNAVPGTATAAAIKTNAGPWSLISGASLTFTFAPVDPPAAGEVGVTFEATPASLQGKVGPFNLSDAEGVGLTLTLTVNGIPQTHQFGIHDIPSLDDLGQVAVQKVAEVLNRFRGIHAFVTDQDALLVRTDREGANALLVAQGSAASVLFGDPSSSAGTGNVADIYAVTPEELQDLVRTAFANGALPGVQVRIKESQLIIEHPKVGSGQKLEVKPTQLGTLTLEVAPGTNGDASIAAKAATAANVGGVLTVTAAYRGTEDPGTWGEKLRVQIETNAGDPQLFDLIVKRFRDDLQKSDILERIEGLSANTGSDRFVKKLINDELAGSRFIKITAVAGAGNPTQTSKDAPLLNGADGAFGSTEAEANAYIAAIDLFEKEDIQLLCCPESAAKAVVEKGVGHAELMQDRIFLGHMAENVHATDAKSFGKELQGNKIYGALYFPWIQINDPIGSRKWIPPTGHIMGVYARTETERGIWKAPAGNAARVNGALDVKYRITDREHTDLVKNASVNAVRFIPGQGIVIDSSRTLSTSPLWYYVNVRLLFNFVKSSLKAGLRWTVQEPNDEALWNKVKYNSVTPFLMGLWRRGAFGPGAAEDVFTVKIDAENNRPEDIQSGRLNIEVYFYPSRPAETILITVGQQEGAASASER